MINNKAEYNHYLILGGLISLCLHIGFIIALNRNPEILTVEPLVVDITLDPLIPPLIPKETQKKQFVSQPESQIAKTVPSETKLLAEKNSVTTKEQIKRGDGPDAGLSSNPTTSRPASAKNTEPLRHLALDKKTLLNKFGKKTQPKSSLLNQQDLNPPAYQAFSRPTGSGARFLGRKGSADYLPFLPDGDITLLNTKANHFAVFVRRVATQVFGQLRVSGWDALRAADIRTIRDFSTVRAIVSLDGKLLKLVLEGSSGSKRFDQVLLNAAKIGAPDPHPPKAAAASDGNIHFIFKAKSWSRLSSGGPHGNVSEQRWLLLSTGLG